MDRAELLKIAKPILFNNLMVQAILDNRKTATRRIMKPQPVFKTTRKFVFNDDECPKKWEDCDNIINTYRYQVGDILYVRETWCKGHINNSQEQYFYKADDNLMFPCKWRPSIHMPKEAARIFLRVSDVSVERLQDITPKQAVDEGVGDLFYEDIGYSGKDYGTEIDEEYGIAKEQFAWLWDSTVKKQELDRYGWNANPWVWVIEFERLEVSE